MGTSGSEGGPGKPISCKADRAPQSDPYTFVATWSGWVYVAFVTDAYARRILGWRTLTSMSTQLVLDGIEHAIWTTGRHGVADLGGVIHHTNAGAQYTAVRFCELLAEAGIAGSAGSVGDSFDNALEHQPHHTVGSSETK